ncbi:MAG: transaminase [Alphaproteobacteria bacterium]
MTRAVDRAKLESLTRTESERFAAEHPESKRLFEAARDHVWGGVPMHWMRLWPGSHPIYAAKSKGARIVDVDGHEYVDFCLGDSGALFGHAPEALVRGAAEQLARGITTMLPTADAAAVAENLADRFGLPLWQFCLSATDANRFAIKLARAATGRARIVVFDGCYHGSLDETLVALRNGTTVPIASNIGPAVDPGVTTRAVPFNDLDRLEDALRARDVACVLAEPALTNFAMVLPEPGFHDGVRALTRRYGSLLVIDEAHTICAGPGGGTRAFGLEPDFVTLGKPIAGGIPAAAYGFSHAVGEAVDAWRAKVDGFVSGIGGTLAGNAFGLHAMRVALEDVLTPVAFAHMTGLAERLATGLDSVIARHGVPWSIGRRGGWGFFGSVLRADRRGAGIGRGRRVRALGHALGGDLLRCRRPPRRDPVPGERAAQRRRGPGASRRGARPRAAPVPAQPGHPDDHLLQRRPDLAGDD